MASGATEHIRVGDLEMAVYVSLPEAEGLFPGIVVAQHAGGIDEFIRTMCDRLAAAGYGAAAPEGASIFDSHASSAATRALRRKVEAQQRMIRMLAIALGLVAVVSVVMTIVTTRATI